MAYYNECPRCGARNDPGVVCECKTNPQAAVEPERMSRRAQGMLAGSVNGMSVYRDNEGRFKVYV